MPETEHILLESDFRNVPDVRAARKVHARVAFRSRLRNRFVQLEIIDYYYLSVRSHSRSSKLEYVLDLRFVDTPRVSRHVSWRWITASLLLTSVVYAIVQLGPATAPGWHRHWITVYAIATGGWAVATLVAVYRTTETVRLFSTDGAARLLECTGGLGTLRRMRRFMAKVAAHVRLAGADRRSTKAAHLRDAMREHARLRQLGVLCEPEYESAKARILGRHFGSPRPIHAGGAAKT
jgi:hypothetical protein